MSDKKRNPLSVLFFTVFIDMLGFGILIPIIPLLFADPTSEFYMLSPSTPLSHGLILLGLLVGIYPFMMFIAAPILGQLSDKHGRRRLLAISLGGTSASYVLFAFGIVTKNIPLLFAARALDGITGGNISIAQAAIADVTEPKDRAKNFGLIGAAFGLGFIFGPFLGGMLGDHHIVSWFNPATPFWFAAALSFLNMMMLLVRMPETLVQKKTYDFHWAQSLKNVAKAYSNKRLRTFFLSLFLFTSGFAFFTSFFNVFLIDKFSFDESNIGAFFAYVGIWVAFTQGFITRRVGKRLRDATVVKIAFFGAGIAVMFYFFTSVWWELLLIAPFFSVCIGLSTAFATSLVSSSVDASSQGEILGVNASVNALAQTIPPVLSGFIAASIFPSAPIIVASATILLAALVFTIFYKPVQAPPDA